jgi:hypothetical protein
MDHSLIEVAEYQSSGRLPRPSIGGKSAAQKHARPRLQGLASFGIDQSNTDISRRPLQRRFEETSVIT